MLPSYKDYYISLFDASVLFHYLQSNAEIYDFFCCGTDGVCAKEPFDMLGTQSKSSMPVTFNMNGNTSKSAAPASSMYTSSLLLFDSERKREEFNTGDYSVPH